MIMGEEVVIILGNSIGNTVAKLLGSPLGLFLDRPMRFDEFQCNIGEASQNITKLIEWEVGVAAHVPEGIMVSKDLDCLQKVSVDRARFVAVCQ